MKINVYFISIFKFELFESKIKNLGILTLFSIAWRFESMTRIELWLEVDIELDQNVDIEYLGRVTMLVSSI